MPCSIARPALFRDYLQTQLEHLVNDYGVEVSVGKSRSEIPYAYVLDGSGINLDVVTAADLSRWFPSNELSHIGDEIADGVWDYALRDARPLALFDGPRTDFSLARIEALHRGTDPKPRPALHPVHQLPPLRRRVRPLRDRRVAARNSPVHGPVGARRAITAASI